MSIRCTTESSIWIVNEASMMVTRMPREERPEHPSAPYEQIGKPMEVATLNIGPMFADQPELGDCIRLTMLDGTPARSGIIIDRQEV